MNTDFSFGFSGSGGAADASPATAPPLAEDVAAGAAMAMSAIFKRVYTEQL